MGIKVNGVGIDFPNFQNSFQAKFLLNLPSQDVQIAVFNATGATGPQGPAGVNGVTGPTGATGPAGGGDVFLSANNFFTGINTFPVVDEILSVDGTKYTTIAQALAACPSEGCTVWVPDGLNPILSSTLTISNPVQLIFGKNTITCTMADPGATSGCIVIASDNVEIVGQGAATVITQPNAQNIQNAIYMGAQGNLKFHDFKLDWNDANQTNAGGFYTGLRSAAGSHDIRVWNFDCTRGGDRGIDFRGCNRSWITESYFHSTGLNVAGVAGRGGNSVSVDVDGTTQSTDCYLENNLVEQQGDSFACAHALRVHINHNTIRGAADFGNTPMNNEAGIDADGNVDCEIIGNHVINVRGPQLTIQSLNVGGVNYVTRNCQIEGNTFVANTTAGGLPATDPRVLGGSISGGGITSGQQTNIGIINNSFDGTRLSIDTVDNLRVKGNSFHNVLSSIVSGIAFDLEQVNGSGAVTKNFVISGNSFDTDNATLLTAVNLGGGITTPDACVITDNATSSTVTNDITAQAGFATSSCYITRSNKTIGAYSNAQSSETIRNATFPDQIVSSIATGTAPFSIASVTPQPTLVVQNWDPTQVIAPFRLKVSDSTLVPGDFSLGGNWGTSPLAVTINNNATDQAGSVTVTAGGGSPGANPTVTLIFHDGSWGNSPQCIGVRADATSPLPSSAPWIRSAISPTAITFTFNGTPVAGSGYVLEWVCIGH